MRMFRNLRKIYGNIWENLWKSMEMFGNVWKCIEILEMGEKISGNVWKCTDMCKNVWKRIEIVTVVFIFFFRFLVVWKVY